MAGWNLGLRFGLEVAALCCIGAAAWQLASGPWKWIGVIVAPLLAATAWGTFNVLDDPSRSGNAPIEVAGVIRLAVELLVLGAGVAGALIATRSWVGGAFAALIVFHYAVSWHRVEWLISA